MLRLYLGQNYVTLLLRINCSFHYTTDITSPTNENYITGVTLVMSYWDTGDPYTVHIEIYHKMQHSMIIDV